MPTSGHGKLWDLLHKVALVKELFSAPIIYGLSWLGAMLSQYVPVVSAFGWFGIFFSGIGTYLLLSICARLQAGGKWGNRRATVQEYGRIDRIMKWRGWQWIIFAACVVIGCSFLELRPRLPSWVSPTLISMPIASYREMQKDKIVGRTVILTEVPRSQKEPLVIENKTFEHCVFWGPAVVVLVSGDDFEHNLIGAAERNPDDVLFITKAQILDGVIGFRGCTIKQCQFREISFVGSAEEIERLRNGMKNER